LFADRRIEIRRLVCRCIRIHGKARIIGVVMPLRQGKPALTMG
jgi:hypothetical protein